MGNSLYAERMFMAMGLNAKEIAKTPNKAWNESEILLAGIAAVTKKVKALEEDLENYKEIHRGNLG